MPENLTVVYAARTLQDAHQLRNLLADAGIHAIVTNESLQGGFGNFLGWQGLTRVVVREEDARAGAGHRHGVRRSASRRRPVRTPPARTSCRRRISPPWPKCPQCGAARTTRCPVCGEIGVDFPASDPDSTGVSRLTCPTCHRSFAAEYRRRCEGCGREFEDGYDVGPPDGAARDEPLMNARIAVVLLTIVALLALLTGWLFYLFR